MCRIPPAQHFILRGPGLFKHHFWLALDFHWNSSKVVFEGEGNSQLKWYPMIERTELTSNGKDGNLSLWFDTNPLGGLRNFNNKWIFTNVCFTSIYLSLSIYPTLSQLFLTFHFSFESVTPNMNSRVGMETAFPLIIDVMQISTVQI